MSKIYLQRRISNTGRAVDTYVCVNKQRERRVGNEKFSTGLSAQGERDLMPITNLGDSERRERGM